MLNKYSVSAEQKKHKCTLRNSKASGDDVIEARRKLSELRSLASIFWPKESMGETHWHLTFDKIGFFRKKGSPRCPSVIKPAPT
jgi:hypothetical protein